MKSFKIFLLILIFLYSCAKPTVLNVKLDGDEKLNCEQLENAIAESQKIKNEAEFAKEGTGGNVARLVLFWPAWAQTLHNADIAIRAADDRIYHLFSIMKKKNCKNVDIINQKITTAINPTANDITTQLKELKKMYDEGSLTKEEYNKAKQKVLD